MAKPVKLSDLVASVKLVADGQTFAGAAPPGEELISLGLAKGDGSWTLVARAIDNYARALLMQELASDKVETKSHVAQTRQELVKSLIADRRDTDKKLAEQLVKGFTRKVKFQIEKCLGYIPQESANAPSRLSVRDRIGDPSRESRDR